MSALPCRATRTLAQAPEGLYDGGKQQMRPRFAMTVAVALCAASASAQSVRDGVSAWQRGDHAVAVATWTPLAAQGDADAAFNLGQAYRFGKGAALDLGRATALFEQAARKGHVEAATTLGLLLFQNGDRAGAMRWLRQAADAGEPRAMLLYGTALYNGEGIARDPVRAYALVSRAAAQGLSAARETLLELDENLPLDVRQRGVKQARTMVDAKSVPALELAGGAAVRPSAPTRLVKLATRAPGPVPSSRDGGWRIQLGAFGQRPSAEALFARLHARLSARQAYYLPAGKVTRLQVGPFDSRAAATAACARLTPHPCFAVEAR
jgi:uncharacterized protein